MPQLNDLYEVTLSSIYLGRECVNVFHYVWDIDFVTLPESDKRPSREIALGFKRVFFDTTPGLAQISTLDVLFTGIRARNLFDEGDQYEVSISVPGTSGGGTSPGSGESLPRFVAQSFSLETETSLKGKKRFPGFGETQQVDGVAIPSVATDTAWTTMQQKLAQRLPLSPLWLSNVAAPVIIKRVRTGAPGSYSYRLPTQQSEAVYARIVRSLFDIVLTSQVSRKG
jgi:hypothetical protein